MDYKKETKQTNRQTGHKALAYYYTFFGFIFVDSFSNYIVFLTYFAARKNWYLWTKAVFKANDKAAIYIVPRLFILVTDIASALKCMVLSSNNVYV